MWFIYRQQRRLVPIWILPILDTIPHLKCVLNHDLPILIDIFVSLTAGRVVVKRAGWIAAKVDVAVCIIVGGVDGLGL